jgi:DMSO/TMAO reductase YedYZ molybdopterin-dependent catalytic subunit
MTHANDKPLSRRRLLAVLGAGVGGLSVAARRLGLAQVSADVSHELPSFTGPGANPYWNSVGPFASYPEKLPLIRLTDRPVQLETPRPYFEMPFTPNDAFYVRWHLDRIPNAVDLAHWRLHVEGMVSQPLALSFDDLLKHYPAVSVAAVNQCSGNSRSRLQPRVAGGQWGNGAMGSALWTGVRLKDLLAAGHALPGAIQVQFEGLDRGSGTEGKGASRFQKALDLVNPVLDECIVAYAMNGAPLPMLNGFPVRLVVPGHFATYWVKALTWIRALDKPDENFWMKTAYRIPDTARGNTTPEAVASGQVRMVPIGTMPVRSFLVAPDPSTKVPVGLPVTARGIAFSGSGRVVRVDVSVDDGKRWSDARLGEDQGPYAFRTWGFTWTPDAEGRHVLAVRATDEKGNVQADAPVWNPGGYLWNQIERQEVTVGPAR